MYKLRMLEENNIAYLLKPISTELDGKIFLKYNTGSDYVIERIMLRMKPDGEFLRVIMSQIFECIRTLGQYLLIPDDIVLEPSYMFYNCSSRELKLVYIPGYGKDIRVQIKGLLEYIMRIFDHRDSKGVQYMYSLYEWVADEGADISAWMNINAYVDEKTGEAISNKDTNVAENGKMTPDIECENNFENNFENNLENKKIALRELILIVNTVAVGIAAVGYFIYHLNWAAIAGIILIVLLVIQLVSRICNMDDDADEAMAEYAANGTMDSSVASVNTISANTIETPMKKAVEMSMKKPVETSMKKPIETPIDIVKEQGYKIDKPTNNTCPHRMVPLNNGSLDAILLDAYNEKIVIGRGKKDTDYRVPTTQISRIHACVHLRNDGVYLEDMNSANGTFINSVRIPSNETRIVSAGDIVSFANEEFFVS